MAVAEVDGMGLSMPPVAAAAAYNCLLLGPHVMGDPAGIDQNWRQQCSAETSIHPTSATTASHHLQLARPSQWEAVLVVEVKGNVVPGAWFIWGASCWQPVQAC